MSDQIEEVRGEGRGPQSETPEPMDDQNNNSTGPETGRIKNVRIDPAENGFIVKIGCKIFVAEKWDAIAEALGLYFKDPEAAVKKFLNK